MVGLPHSVSGVDEDRLDMDGLCELRAGLSGPELEAPELDSEPTLVELRSGGRAFPDVSSDPSVRALRRALARLSRNCFVASFGSDALSRISQMNCKVPQNFILVHLPICPGTTDSEPLYKRRIISI